MHGIGNDFVMVNAFSQELPSDLPELSRQMCHRKFGVGADGLILASPGGQEAPFSMRMFNPDGSESEMCGNGVRCFALFVRAEGLTELQQIPVVTGAGLLQLEVLPDERVRVDMGPARLTRGEIGMTGDPAETFMGQDIYQDRQMWLAGAVSMGNPHLVIPVPDASAVALEEVGPKLERHPQFPQRVNVHFVQVESRLSLIQRTWERGAGATLACGTGACAAAVACHLMGLCERKVTVRLPGGALEIEYRVDGRVWMTGPAASVFTAEWIG